MKFTIKDFLPTLVLIKLLKIFTLIKVAPRVNKAEVFRKS